MPLLRVMIGGQCCGGLASPPPALAPVIPRRPPPTPATPAPSTPRRSNSSEEDLLVLGIAVTPPVPTGTVPPLPSSSFVRLADGVEAFHEIREMLRGGGLGKIARLTPAEPVGRPPTTRAPDIDVVNPDSETYDLAQTLAILAFSAGAAL